MEENTIVASLPTSINNAPSLITTYGCIDIPEKQFNCFVFAKNIPICDNEECFPRDTHVYGEQIEAYTYDQLTAGKVLVDGIDYEVIGNFKKDVFTSLLDCIKTSNAIKARVLKLLKD